MKAPVTSAEKDASGQGWLLRILLGWHASFALMGVVLVVLAAFERDPWFVYAVVALIGVAYAVVGAPALGGTAPAGHGWFFLALAFAGTLGMVAVDGLMSIALYVLLPAAFALLQPIRIAVWACLAVTLASDVLILSRRGWTPAAVSDVAVQTATVWLFALLVGFFVTQLLTENRRRGELIAELENVRSELTESYHEAGVQSERYRLAQEIHDTVGQGLTSLLMLIRAADAAIPADPERAHERLALAQKTATDNLAEVRAVISASGPAGLSGSPLDVAIGKVVARLGQELGIEATAEVLGEPRAPSTDVQVVLLRAVQEALANVRKHAHATRVRVRVRYHARSVELEVADDGRGFVTDGASGFGLAGMRARVEQVSGMMTVSSTPGSGTTIKIEVSC